MASVKKGNHRKSSGKKSHPLLSGPVVKRMLTTPVILEGWLQKRGSEGLMLWKKRWFVLSDYCLFYYKDTLEEKLLGSFILASYKISPCLPDEKGFKKYSFKAEHTNMRTYYFAAENQALMEQWITALTKAALVEAISVSDANRSGHLVSYAPASGIYGEFYPGSVREIGYVNNLKCAESQPVYANAPPKPKRLNESSSPELPPEVALLEEGLHSFSPNNIHLQGQYFPILSLKHQSPSNNYERRTPDTYGRANTNQLSPKVTNVQTVRELEEDDHDYVRLRTRNLPSHIPPRPHSVDFLDYNGKIHTSTKKINTTETCHQSNARPKSSLSRMNTADENTEAVHWSAESYAKQMRQSSIYVKSKIEKSQSSTGKEILSDMASNYSETKLNTSSGEQNNNKSDNLSDSFSRMDDSTNSTTENKSFARSVSARLYRSVPSTTKGKTTDINAHSASNTKQDNSNSTQATKAQQREESMKRLLEWKQRMLQSPLTRKPVASLPSERHPIYKASNNEATYQNLSKQEPSEQKPVNQNEPVILEKPHTPKITDISSKEINDVGNPSISPGFYNSSLDDADLECGKSTSACPKNNFQRETRIKETCDNQTFTREGKISCPQMDITVSSQNLNKRTHELFDPNKQIGNENSNEDPSFNYPENIGYENDLLNKEVFNYSYNYNQDVSMKPEKKILPIEEKLKSENEEAWGVKLDESRVIKEFSYHYITSGKSEDLGLHFREFDAHKNNMRNNFKVSEAPQTLNHDRSQEENNISNYFSSENHLDIQKDIRTNVTLNQAEKNVFEKRNKISQQTNNRRKNSKLGIANNKGNQQSSVLNKENQKVKRKDLFAKNLSPEDNVEKRQVLSDTEALLYDTSSDLDEKSQFPREGSQKPLTSSDEDRDEEVAAVLVKQKTLVYPCYDSVDFALCNSEIKLKINTNVEDTSGKELHVIITGQNDNISVNHEKSLSASTSVNSDNQEENYMPMTPRKKSHSSKNDIKHVRSNSASHTLIENLLESTEESPYVEMTQNCISDSISNANKIRYSQSSNSKKDFLISGSSLQDNSMPSYCEIGSDKEMQYELIYNASVLQEPVYMEVPSLKEKDEQLYTLFNASNVASDVCSKKVDSHKSGSSKPSLPDILHSAATPGGAGRSDSSDADDEASKDLDSLDAPRHPRFSLSDTFRPASYYLGSSVGDRTVVTLNLDHPDSSDSDLVSPPPIPTSSPPLDDIDTSIDSSINNKESSPVYLKSDSAVIYSNSMFLRNSSDKTSSYKIKNVLRNSNVHLYEASSEESVDLGKKEQLLKRRPLSADILNNLHGFNIVMSDTPTRSSNLCTEDIGILPTENTDNSGSLKVYKYPNTKHTNMLTKNREKISQCNTSDQESEQDFVNRENNFIDGFRIFYDYDFQFKNELGNAEITNQYENLKILGEEANVLESNVRLKKKGSLDTINNLSEHVFKENKIPNLSNEEHQTNAPYYYSDLLKIDSNNFQDLEKNKWRIDQIFCDQRELTSPYVKQSPDSKNYSTIENKLKNNKSQKSSGNAISVGKSKVRSLSSGSSTLRNSRPETSEYLNFSINKNVYDIGNNVNAQFTGSGRVNDSQTPLRSRSLEGLIDNKKKNSESHDDFEIPQKNNLVSHVNFPQGQNSCLKSEAPSSNNDIWEEDSLWRESLRKVSIRHTRSLEDLDRKAGQQVAVIPPSVANISEINETSYHQTLTENSEPVPQDHQLTYITYDNLSKKDNVNYTSKSNEVPSSSIQFQKKDETMKYVEVRGGKGAEENSNPSFEIDREKLRQWDLMSSAPATLSSSTRPVVKAVAPADPTQPPGPPPLPSNQTGEGGTGGEVVDSTKESNISGKIPVSGNTSTLTDFDQGNSWNIKVSAGELLGRTHEELVLLLIQLRRQRATVCQAMEKCHREIETQACLTDLDTNDRIENLQKLDELKSRLVDLEKQYEKGKPLVNLVDNMVKLGSLYQAGSPQKLEFIQRIQEQRLLAEEKRDWERIRPDHHELQAKVERLYRLDKLLQEESGALHSLQQDKGVLERALGGLRHKLQSVHSNSPETEWYKRQQRLLERELSRIRSVLALNSKRLEETVAENARLEQELVVLRQKLQLSRRTAEPGGATTAALEAELCRVQLSVGNLLRQRQELSLQVRQLTEKSNSLSQQIWPGSPYSFCEASSPIKKNVGGWMETDLDGEVGESGSSLKADMASLRRAPLYISPLYVNTTPGSQAESDRYVYQEEVSPLSAKSSDLSRLNENTDEDIVKHSYGLHWKEKPQEIKTVRIVKRESERRQRDRDRSGNIGIPITYSGCKRPIITEEPNGDKLKQEEEVEELVDVGKVSEPPPTPGPRTDSVNAVWNLVRKNKWKGKLQPRSVGDPTGLICDSPQLSPVYLSEAARKIVEEVAWQGVGEKRLIPKEKRRHHTMSGTSFIAPQRPYSQRSSRDDLDMERVLRPRLTTPDVVRSTLIRVDPNYTKETIDNILGAPGKIIIPERYIPETQPQLTREELNQRSKKADAIRKMLCDISAVPPKDKDVEGSEKSSTLKIKVAEEKKNREHLLQLSQILAQQVMEKSKIVAGGNSTAPPD